MSLAAIPQFTDATAFKRLKHLCPLVASDLTTEMDLDALMTDQGCGHIILQFEESTVYSRTCKIHFYEFQ